MAIYMFFEMRFDLGTLDSGERSLPFGLLVFVSIGFYLCTSAANSWYRPFSLSHFCVLQKHKLHFLQSDIVVC